MGDMPFSALSLSTFYVKNLKHRKIYKLRQCRALYFFQKLASVTVPRFGKVHFSTMSFTGKMFYSCTPFVFEISVKISDCHVISSFQHKTHKKFSFPTKKSCFVNDLTFLSSQVWFKNKFRKVFVS